MGAIEFRRIRFHVYTLIRFPLIPTIFIHQIGTSRDSLLLFFFILFLVLGHCVIQ